MATLNVSFLNPNLRKTKSGSSIGILTDEVTILENELGKDGYLSQGDYDLLLEKTRSIRATPGLTPAQIKNIDVKVSFYEKNKTIAASEKADNLQEMNRSFDSERNEDVMISGNNPQEYLSGRNASLIAKMDDLNESIERRSASGQDITEYQNEYNETLRQYQSNLEAMSNASTFDGSGPIAGYVAYVTTNSNGEIVDVDYGRYGAKNGYVETNGMIDGFQVYGKVNAKRDGKNYFVLGNQTFSGADMIIPDPENPGSFKADKLVANVKQQGPLSVGQSGYINIPGGEIQVQSYLPRNSYAKGVNGTIYKRRDDGGYTKYINTDVNTFPDIDPNQIINLPQSYERNLMRNVDETIDGAEPITPDEGFSSAPMDFSNNLPEAAYPNQPESPLIRPQQSSPSQPRSVGVKQGSSPTERAGSGFADTAKRTVASAANYVKNLF